MEKIEFRLRSLLPFLALALSAFSLAVSCTDKSAPVVTETMSWADTTRYVAMSVNLDLPIGKSSTQKRMREALIDAVSKDIFCVVNCEEDESFAPAGLDEKGLGLLFSSTFAAADSLSKADFDDMAFHVLEEESSSDEEKHRIIDMRPSWEITAELTKEVDSAGYVVFLSTVYTYLGGAHGGVSGSGYITFDKSDGSMVLDFLKPDCTAEMQPLLRRGLCSYFSEDGAPVDDSNLDSFLFEQDGLIPLPSEAPYPSSEGLTFVYQQYEIACYAAGMPSFIIPYEDLKPFLTDKASGLFIPGRQ